MRSSKFLTLLKTVNNVPIVTGVFEIIPYGNIYPSGALTLTNEHDGIWSHAGAPDGEYSLYYNGVICPSYQRFWIGENKITLLSAMNFKDDGSIKDEVISFPKLDPTLQDLVMSHGTGSITNFEDGFTIQKNTSDNSLSAKGTVVFGTLGAISTSASVNTTSINNAISSLGSGGVLIIASPGRIKINNLTIFENFTLKVLPGSILDIQAGQSLTIFGKIEAGIYQIFGTDGIVNLSSAKIKEAYPEWWGAKDDGSDNPDDTDNALMFTRAFNSGARTIAFTGMSGDGYYIHSNLNIDLAERSLKIYSSVGSIIMSINTASANNYYDPEGCNVFRNGKVEIDGVNFCAVHYGEDPATNFLSVLQIISCTKVNINNVIEKNGIYCGLHIINCTNVTITNSEFSHNLYAGMMIRGCKNVRLLNCTASYNGLTAPVNGYGISISGRFPYPRPAVNYDIWNDDLIWGVDAIKLDNENILIDGCTANYNLRKGIDVHGGIGVRIAHNFVKGFGYTAIYAVNEGGEPWYEKVVRNVTILDNEIENDPTWYASLGVGSGNSCPAISVGSYGAPIFDGGVHEVIHNHLSHINISQLRFGIQAYLNSEGPVCRGIRINDNTVLDAVASYAAIGIYEAGGIAPGFAEISRNKISGTSTYGVYIAQGGEKHIIDNLLTGTFTYPAVADGANSITRGNTYNSAIQDNLNRYIDSKLNIRDSIIEEIVTDTDSGEVSISYTGYQSGTTRYRNFVVYDGKHSAVCKAFGSDKSIEFYGTIRALGALVTTSSYVPASATAAGAKGQWAWDADYLYQCVDTDMWVRFASAKWV